jgi:tetratricopeptide (TPR) repeat protein
MRLLALLLVCSCCSAATFEKLAEEAAAARDANNVPEAIELYSEALQQKAAWSEGWWFLGTLLYDSDQYRRGEDAFAHFVKLDESAAPGWSFLGLCEFETGDYAQALNHIERGLGLGTGLPPATVEVLRFHKALLLTKTGLFDQALPQFIPFARKGSRDPSLIAGIGLAALRQAALPKEIPAAQQDLVAKAGIAAYFWMADEAGQADSAFAALLTSYPAGANVHYLYGTYLLASRPRDALAEFERELELNPHSADARAMTALLHIRAGDSSAALPYARKAAEDGPTTPMAQFVFGLLLSEAGDVSGIEHLEAAERLDPPNLEYHIALAGAYSKFGRHEDARRERAASIAMAKESDPRVHK